MLHKTAINDLSKSSRTRACWSIQSSFVLPPPIRLSPKPHSILVSQLHAKIEMLARVLMWDSSSNISFNGDSTYRIAYAWKTMKTFCQFRDALFLFGNSILLVLLSMAALCLPGSVEVPAIVILFNKLPTLNEPLTTKINIFSVSESPQWLIDKLLKFQRPAILLLNIRVS